MAVSAMEDLATVRLSAMEDEAAVRFLRRMKNAAPPPIAAIGGPPPPDASASAASVLSTTAGVAVSSPPVGVAVSTPPPVGVAVSSPPVGVVAVDSVMLGTDSTVMPSAAEAAAAVPRLEESEVCSAAGVVEAGTAIVAVMITLAAATRRDTEAASTPALAAIEFWRAEVSE
eukprot:scaffold131867_cov48-Phaeocystis_antarctica.AAC.1